MPIIATPIGEPMAMETPPVHEIESQGGVVNPSIIIVDSRNIIIGTDVDNHLSMTDATVVVVAAAVESSQEQQTSSPPPPQHQQEATNDTTTTSTRTRFGTTTTEITTTPTTTTTTTTERTRFGTTTTEITTTPTTTIEITITSPSPECWFLLFVVGIVAIITWVLVG
jgi:cobalamin biosynthesis Mg chelatase CobN